MQASLITDICSLVLGLFSNNTVSNISQFGICGSKTFSHWMSGTIVITKYLKLFGLYLATQGNDDVQTPIHPESDENQRDYDADDEVSNLSSPFSEITDPGCEDEDYSTTGDHKYIFL